MRQVRLSNTFCPRYEPNNLSPLSELSLLWPVDIFQGGPCQTSFQPILREIAGFAGEGHIRSLFRSTNMIEHQTAETSHSHTRQSHKELDNRIR